MPTVIKGETMPATTNPIAPDPNLQAGPSTAIGPEATIPISAEPEMTAPVMNEGKGHSSTRLPPYGPEQTATSTASPGGFPTSSMYPPHPFQWGDQQYGMMYNGMPMSPYANRMAMMNYPMGMGGGGGYYGGMSHHPYGPSPYLYPSSSLLDYAYGMHDPYYGMGGHHPYYSGFPYSASALPVQDKRLLPERNYFSAVKDIWRTNLQ
ncbi:hypothetical protein BCR42DRAFT_390857 [Absidia repens]|uniref:Uncharacterized protein n=1 Tax=Absidia repens TaxID=90262 RepID=A0A1X2ILV2_9FUNG|nr:hypothetical protein BCR42DRAFT_390857 [Absidia repens]